MSREAMEWHPDVGDGYACYIGDLFVGSVRRMVGEKWRTFPSLAKHRDFYEQHEAKPWRTWYPDSEDGSDAGWFASADEGKRAIELRVAAALSAPDGGREDWRTIESAPKAYDHPYTNPSERGASTFVLIWNGFHCGVAWCQQDYGDTVEWWGEDDSPVEPPPTHWMPLPKPPSSGAGGGG